MGSREEEAFQVKDCVLITVATGVNAFTLKELRDGLKRVGEQSVFHHFWGGLLEPRFEEREYNNDFASWVRHSAHEAALAEQLAMVDPTTAADLEDLRGQVIDLIDNHLDSSDYLAWVRASSRFDFLRSQIVVFETDAHARSPRELIGLIPGLSDGSIFYHLIDARRRSPEGIDDFQAWLRRFGAPCEPVCHALAGLDPYFTSLAETRERLGRILRNVPGYGVA